MHQLSFQFTAQNLQLWIADSVAPQKLLSIEEKIDNLLVSQLAELVSSPTNSYGLFNNASGLSPIPMHPTFEAFLRLNFHYLQLSQGSFNPFEGALDWQALVEKMEWYPEEGVVIRNSEIQLNNSHLLPAYLMDLVSKLLVQEKLHNYLIFAGNYYLSHGSDGWEVEFQNPLTEEPMEMVIASEAAVMRQSKLEIDIERLIDRTNPFAKIPQFPLASAAIVEASRCTYATLIAELALNVDKEWELQNFADAWEVGLTLITRQGAVLQLQPQA